MKLRLASLLFRAKKRFSGVAVRSFCISLQYFKSNHGAYFTGDVAQERVRALTLARVLLQQPPNTHSEQCWKQVGDDRDFSAALYMRACRKIYQCVNLIYTRQIFARLSLGPLHNLGVCCKKMFCLRKWRRR
jgi:hypothetical protein